MAADVEQVLARGPAVHVVDRQQQRVIGLKAGEEHVRDDFHVGPHLAHQVHQRKPVERADRVVRDDHDAAVARDAFHVASADLVGEIEISQYFVDKIETFEMRVAFLELLDFGFVKQRAQKCDQVLARESGCVGQRRIIDV